MKKTALIVPILVIVLAGIALFFEEDPLIPQNTSTPTTPPISTTALSPNIILLMSDDQGYGQVGYMDHPYIKTPTLDEMARNGLVLSNFYASAPICSPTRVSVLTGQHHTKLSCQAVGCNLPESAVTLPEVLQKYGYRTGHFGKWHIGKMKGPFANPPGNHGFDTWYSHPRFFDIGDSGFYDNGRQITQPIDGDGSEYIVNQALKFIGEASRANQPFFTVIWYGSPHSPYVALEEDKALFVGLPEDEQNMYSEILAMDRSIGTLRKELVKQGVADNTLLWFNGDNGGSRTPDPQANGELSGYKNTLNEGGIRVPAVIEWADGISTPQTSDVPSSTLDIMPTILDIVFSAKFPNTQKDPLLSTLDGKSLTPLFEGKNTVAKGIPFWYEADETDLTQTNAAWIEDNYKIYKIPAIERISYEFYDLKIDPSEEHNLASERPDIVANLLEKLDAWQTVILETKN